MPSVQRDPFQEQRALLVSSDVHLFSSFAQRFKEYGACLDIVGDVTNALSRVEQEPIEIVLVDCSVPHHLECIRFMRKHKRRVICLAIGFPGLNAKALFSMGAMLVIYQPLTAESARSSVRAALNLSGRQLRRTPRFSLLPIVQISLSVDQPLFGQIIDISETGMGIETDYTSVMLAVGNTLEFRLMLPGVRRTIQTSGKIVRIDHSRRLGVRFLNFFNATDRKLLGDWIRYMSEFWAWRENGNKRSEPEHRANLRFRQNLPRSG